MMTGTEILIISSTNDTVTIAVKDQKNHETAPAGWQDFPQVKPAAGQITAAGN